jgi:hypothetical protein
MGRGRPLRTSSPKAFNPESRAVEVEVHDWSRIERQHLADDQPADDGDAQRPAPSA